MFGGLPYSPVALDFVWASFPWCPYRARHIRRFSSGWLRVTRARLELPFATYQRDLLLCVDDYQKQIFPGLAESLLQMRTTYPYAPDEPEPYDILDALEKRMVRQFAMDSEGESLELLARQEDERARKIMMAEQSARRVMVELEGGIRTLRSRLRWSGIETEERDEHLRRITRLEDYLDRIPPALRREQIRMRRDHDDLEGQVMASFATVPETETLYSVRWRIT